MGSPSEQRSQISSRKFRYSRFTALDQEPPTLCKMIGGGSNPAKSYNSSCWIAAARRRAAVLQHAKSDCSHPVRPYVILTALATPTVLPSEHICAPKDR